MAGPRGCPPVAVRRVRGVGGRAGRRPGGRIRGDGDPSPRDPSPVGRPQGHPSPAGRPEGLPCHWPGRGTRCRSAGVVRRGREHASRAAGRARPRGSAGRSWRSARPAPHDCGGGRKGGRRSAAGDHAASPRGPPPASRPEGHPRCWPGRGAGPRGSSAGGWRTRRGRPGAHDRGERGSAAEKAWGTADRVAGPRGCHPVRVSRVRGVGKGAGRRPRGARETGRPATARGQGSVRGGVGNAG